jgi:ribosomal protein S18 acetylase RimI-like enzyme
MSPAGARLLAIDHVQLAMPAGGEEQARAFYIGVLGLNEHPKPAVLAARGGAWFGNDHVQLHLGVEADFRAARKAHPALRVDDLNGLAAACRSAGHPPEFDTAVPGVARFYVADPFGNRLEFISNVPTPAFRDIDLDRDGATCVAFRIDSYVESFGSADRFYEQAGPRAERYLDGLRAKLGALPGSCVHAWLGDQIVGQLELRRAATSPAEGYVSLYYLAPAYRGVGLGDALDQFATDFFRTVGVIRATLHVSPTNARALAYYRKHGWCDRGVDAAHPEVHVMEREFVDTARS